MITVLLKGGAGFVEVPTGPQFALPEDAVWVDLLNPSREEELACEAALGSSLPTREEMAEIETSSRLYKDNGSTVMTAAVLANSDGETPIEGPVTFVLVGSRLATIRYIEPKAFSIVIQQSQREPQLCTSGPAVFIALVEALVDRLADVVERTSAEVEALSSLIFGAGQARDYRPIMKQLGRAQNVNAKARNSLASIARLSSFAMLLEAVESHRDFRDRLKSIQRDVGSITEHSNALSANVAFMLDATLGLINVEQNAIIKFFSVAAVVFLPPTLVASYFGMNFHHMPELDWRLGEPMAFGLMIVSVLAPLWWFKKRGWL